jgi:hypothetical protein
VTYFIMSSAADFLLSYTDGAFELAYLSTGAGGDRASVPGAMFINLRRAGFRSRARLARQQPLPAARATFGMKYSYWLTLLTYE